MVINPQGPLCGCGARGCLEVYASAQGIKRMALDAIEKGMGYRILRYTGGDIKSIESEHIFNAAQNGDPVAQDIFNQIGRILGFGIVNLVNLFNPEKIVVGGKVSRAWEYFINSVKETVNERAMRGPRERVEIVKATFIDEAGMLGAAYSLLKTLD
jgi:glucokinase